MNAGKSGPVAIVTGGASGIGLATADILLEQGWRVVAFDLPQAAEAASEKHAKRSDRLRFAAVDVCDESAVERAVAQVQETFGPLRGLVTSAGIARDLPFFDTTADIFRRIHEVNVIGTFVAARAAAAAMRDGGSGGAIVTVGSVSGLLGNIGRAAYGASKGAIVNLTRIMAVELARYGIRVNCVAPGPIETPMVAEVHTDSIRAQWHDRVLLERYGRPDEIAQAAAFLLDDARAGYVTGQILAVDGGFVAGGILGRDRA